jgi:hypothetical protein
MSIFGTLPYALLLVNMAPAQVAARRSRCYVCGRVALTKSDKDLPFLGANRAGYICSYLLAGSAWGAMIDRHACNSGDLR